jgi:hypothetical protein
VKTAEGASIFSGRCLKAVMAHEDWIWIQARANNIAWAGKVNPSVGRCAAVYFSRRGDSLKESSGTNVKWDESSHAGRQV